jgi:HD superfamily phosphohydrolase
MDRLDYLNRDSFFTGVYEGVIGYDRIIKMLSVSNGELVVEEKGRYSIEKFLIARRLMYWQVYLHKTVLSAEQMLISAFKRARLLVRSGLDLPSSPALHFFLSQELTADDFTQNREELLEQFAALDDFDVVSALKIWTQFEDRILSFLSSSILNRKLFRLEFSDTHLTNPMSSSYNGILWNGISVLPQNYHICSSRVRNLIVPTASSKTRLKYYTRTEA